MVLVYLEELGEMARGDGPGLVPTTNYIFGPASCAPQVGQVERVPGADNCVFAFASPFRSSAD